MAAHRTPDPLWSPPRPQDRLTFDEAVALDRADALTVPVEYGCHCAIADEGRSKAEYQSERCATCGEYFAPSDDVDDDYDGSAF